MVTKILATIILASAICTAGASGQENLIIISPVEDSIQKESETSPAFTPSDDNTTTNYEHGIIRTADGGDGCGEDYQSKNGNGTVPTSPAKNTRTKNIDYHDKQGNGVHVEVKSKKEGTEGTNVRIHTTRKNKSTGQQESIGRQSVHKMKPNMTKKEIADKTALIAADLQASTKFLSVDDPDAVFKRIYEKVENQLPQCGTQDKPSGQTGAVSSHTQEISISPHQHSSSTGVIPVRTPQIKTTHGQVPSQKTLLNINAPTYTPVRNLRNPGKPQPPTNSPQHQPGSLYQQMQANMHNTNLYYTPTYDHPPHPPATSSQYHQPDSTYRPQASNMTLTEPYSTPTCGYQPHSTTPYYPPGNLDQQMQANMHNTNLYYTPTYDHPPHPPATNSQYHQPVIHIHNQLLQAQNPEDPMANAYGEHDQWDIPPQQTNNANSNPGSQQDNNFETDDRRPITPNPS
jgi:hypothetical protein